MDKIVKQELVNQVVMGVRQYGISNVLFRNVIAEKLGVNSTDMECLGLLFHKKIATPSELSKHTGLSSGSTTAILDRLEKAGIIKREPNPEDRRGTLITIVQEETEKLAPLFESGRKAQNNLISSYSENELELFADFFNKLVNMMNQEREKLQNTIDEEHKEGGENK